MSKYIIEFRSGNYFSTLHDTHGVLKSKAREFDSKESAEQLMDENTWILFNGGMVVEK